MARIISVIFLPILLFAFQQSFGAINNHLFFSDAADAVSNTSTNHSLLISRIIPMALTIIGLGIAGIWTRDIASGKFSGQGSFLRWKEGENMLWPHIFAEYLTAAGLIAGAAGLFFLLDWGVNVSLIFLGAVAYSAINSSGWVLARKSRLAYGAPMWVSLFLAIAAMLILIR